MKNLKYIVWGLFVARTRFANACIYRNKASPVLEQCLRHCISRLKGWPFCWIVHGVICFGVNTLFLQFWKDGVAVWLLVTGWLVCPCGTILRQRVPEFAQVFASQRGVHTEVVAMRFRLDSCGVGKRTIPQLCIGLFLQQQNHNDNAMHAIQPAKFHYT